MAHKVEKKKIQGIITSVNFYNDPIAFEIDVTDKKNNIYHAKWPGQKVIKGIFPSGEIKVSGSCLLNGKTFITPDYELIKND
jgi:hypothetical protein